MVLENLEYGNKCKIKFWNTYVSSQSWTTTEAVYLAPPGKKSTGPEKREYFLAFVPGKDFDPLHDTLAGHSQSVDKIVVIAPRLERIKKITRESNIFYELGFDFFQLQQAHLKGSNEFNRLEAIAKSVGLIFK